MIVTALKPATEISQPTVSLIAHQPTMKSYHDLLESG